MAEPSRHSEKTVLSAILLARTSLNMPVRLTYFFLPAISRGLGVSLTAASALVSVRSLTGITAPLFGTLSDGVGGRRVMLLGLALLVAGAALSAGTPWYGVALLGFGVLGLSKGAYDPAVQAYLGQRVPYERRGRALGVAELPWSASLLGMPLCGWLIERFGWGAPFGFFAALGLFSWWVTRRALTPNRRSGRAPSDKAGRAQDLVAALGRNMRQLTQDRDARLALAITALLIFAQDILMIVFGAWMEHRHGLTLTALGAATLVIGVAELIAELGVALLSDRLGKRRGVFLGVAVLMVGYLVLPGLTGNLFITLAGTAFVILAFEFSIVGLLPIISGLNAAARGTLMSLNVVAGSLARMVAAPSAVALYRPGDLTRNGLVSAGLCVLVLMLLYILRERDY
jgi:predicted MFS family arabinose efflux permease